MVKILRLGNSTDLDPAVPESDRIPWVAAREFGVRIGQQVEVIVKPIWPTDGLSRAVESWLDQHQPDIVVICMNSFWYTYPSVPLRLRRRLGPLGGVAANAGLWVGGTKPISRSRLYHLGRHALTRTIGGDVHFTREHSLAAIERIIRLVIAREEIIPLVRGGMTAHGSDVSRTWARESLRRWRAVEDELQAMCARLHVEFNGLAEPELTNDPDVVSSDFVHPTPKIHRRRAEWEVAGLIRAWERVHGPVPALVD